MPNPHGSAAKPPTYRLSSARLGGAAALREFEEAAVGAFTARPDAPGDFRIDLNARNLGCLVMTQTASSAARFERSKRMIARTGTDHVYLVRYTMGGSTGTVEGRDFHVRTSDIALFDLTRTRQTRSEAFRNLTLVLPRALLEARGVDVDGLHGLVLARELPLTAMISAHLDALTIHAPRLSAAEAEAMGQATVAMIASLLERHPGTPRIASAQRGRAEVMRHINANLGDPELSPARLMTLFGISRAALYRMFEADGGIAQVIRERRLTEAAILLGAPGGRGLRISEVARRLGFVDDSSFSRAFRAHFGISPREAREQPIAAAVAPGGSDRAELAAWVRRLAR